MADGGFFGGLSGGLGEQQAANLAAQKQAALESNETKAAAVNQVDAVLKNLQEHAKAIAESGGNNQDVLKLVNPLVAQLTAPGPRGVSIASAANISPEVLMQRATMVATRPPLEDADKKPVAVKPGENLVHPTTGKVIYSAPALDPITGRPVQPQLRPSDVITPEQAQRANPPMSAAAAPVQQSSGPAAPDGTPAQTVAARFTGPSDQGVIPPTAPQTPQGPTLPPNAQPGAEAIDYAIKNNVVGPAFLPAIPAQMRNTITGLADYKVNPDALSKRVNKDGQSEYTRFLSWAHQYTNGEYDPKYYKPMQAAIKEFTSGGVQSPAGQITVGNTAIAHGGQVADAIDKMAAVPGLLDKIAKSDTPMVSYAANALKNQSVRGTSEGQALQAFLTASHHFVDETTKFYAGGQPAEAGRARGLENFNAAKSTAELYQSLNSESELLSGKVGALQDRWKTALAGPRMGDLLIRNAIPDFPILSEASKTALDRIGQGYLATKFKGTSGSSGAVDFRTYFGKQ